VLFFLQFFSVRFSFLAFAFQEVVLLRLREASVGERWARGTGLVRRPPCANGSPKLCEGRLRRRGGAVHGDCAAIATATSSLSLCAQNDPSHRRRIRALTRKSRRKVTSQSHERRKHRRNEKKYHYMDCEPLSSPSQHRWSNETPRALYDGTNVLGTCHTSRSPGYPQQADMGNF
jgi:hypothetical protein